MGLFSGLFGGGGESEAPPPVQLKPWEQYPAFDPSMQYLSTVGTNLLEGNPNSYYAPIGEWGGSELQSVMDLINRDTTKSVNEQMAAQNMGRSGVAQTAVAQSVADAGRQLRFQDYVRALAGRESLLNTGINTVGAVADKSLNYMNLKNNWGLNQDQLLLGQRAQAVKEANENSDAKGNFWAQLLQGAMDLGNTYMNKLQTTPSDTTRGSASIYKPSNADDILNYKYPSYSM